jgi:hypothetical protein
MKRIAFKVDDTLQVIRLGNTSNDKIEADKKRKIVQTYTFSRKQYELIQSGADKSPKLFFSIADTNCLDCPYNEYGKCYTHKFNQYVGFVSMLKSIAKKYGEFDNIPKYNEDILFHAANMSKKTYVRFGTYGEPSLHPMELIKHMVQLCDNYTGYTHQYKKHKELGKYFMASTHTKNEAVKASKMGYQSFIATNTIIDDAVSCPASKEAGYKSSCSKCSLCSGTEGKGKKDIFILNH